MRLLKGNPVSAGIAIGRAYIYKAYELNVFESYFDPSETERRMAQYESAVAGARQELDQIIEKLQREEDDKYEIFEAHKEILEDEEIVDQIRSAIADDCAMPDYAVDQVFSAFAKLLAKAKDPLIAARAADLRDVRNRLVRVIHCEPERNLANLPEEVIVIAHDLLPSDTATLDRSRVLGIITEVGGATSHSAIIARSYGIPAVLGVPDACAVIHEGDTCIADALSGTVYVRADESTVTDYLDKQRQYRLEAAEIQKFYALPGRMADGEKVEIGLNAGSPEYTDAYDVIDFVGLLRSEFLYMQSDHMPTEEEQYRAYAQVLTNAAGHPVTLRTLDIGGDKSLPYFDLPKEDNPFLGNRALRLCLSHPEIFNIQLRAALRASVKGPLWLMFPMVGSMDDVRAAKAAVEQAKSDLRSEGIPFDENVKIGVMIEIPAMAEIADLVAREVDFASVGTNDLAQYTHAVDRMNAAVADYYQSFSPAMLRSLGRIFRAFRDAGKPVSVCGEMGGNPAAAVVMVGLGLRKLSMSGSNIARVKRVLSRFTMAEAEALASQVVDLPTQAEILECINSAIAKKMED